MIVYHVVTDRPMNVGQKIIFDVNNHSGVYQRVVDKIDIVNEIYKNPKNYQADKFEFVIQNNMKLKEDYT